jgi:hypothetical protein
LLELLEACVPNLTQQDGDQPANIKKEREEADGVISLIF